MQVDSDTAVRLEAARVPEAAQTLSRAFFDDPMSVFVLPDDAHREQALPVLFTMATTYGHLFGEVYATAGTMSGAAIWIPPDSGTMTAERLGAAGNDSIAPAFGAEAMGRFSTLMDETEALHRRDMPGSHWYLMVLGVDPPRQGLGIGGRLLQPVLAQADAGGLPCYLETMKSRNVPFYRKHGFEVVVETDSSGGLHYWTMRRPARR